MLADLLTETLTATLIARGASIRNKTILIVFGSITLVTSLCLLFYFRSLPPTTVESYYSKEITYSRAYYDTHSNSSKIVLVSGEQKYSIYYNVWQNHYSPETIVDGLAKSNHAKIWLDSPDSRGINGIITPTFSIDPLLGVAWDNENRGAGEFLAWMFILCGAILIIIPLFFSSYL